MKIRTSSLIKYLLLFALVIQSMPVAALQNPFKKMGEQLKKGGEKIAASFKELGEKTKEKIDEFAALTTPKLIEKLLEQINKLKDQFKQFGGRIVTGNLPEKDKATILITVVSIVTLTGLVVSVSLSQLKQQQENNLEQKVKEISSQTSAGIKGLFERANNNLQEFEGNVRNLGDCLKTRKCSQGQKQLLYGSAITVAALAVLAIGIGAGALFYKKHKEAQAQEERKAQEAIAKAEKEAKEKERQKIEADALAKQKENQKAEADALAKQAAANKEKFEKEEAQKAIAAEKATKEAQRLKEEAEKETATKAEKEAAEKAKKEAEAKEDELRKARSKAVFQEAAQKAAQQEAEKAEKARKEAEKKQQEAEAARLKAEKDALNAKLAAAPKDSLLKEIIGRADTQFKKGTAKVEAYFETIAEKAKTSNEFQITATKVKELLDEAKSTAQQAMKVVTTKTQEGLQKAQELKADLAIKANELFEKAKKASTDFIQKATSSTATFYAHALAEIFKVDVDPIKGAFAIIMKEANEMTDTVKKTTDTSIFTQIKQFQSALQEWQNALNKVIENKAETTKQLITGGEYYDALKKVWVDTPALIMKINDFNLDQFGAYVHEMTATCATLIESVKQLQKIPVVGPILISKNMNGLLTLLAVRIKRLGNQIKDIFNQKPIITEVPTGTGMALVSALTAFLTNIREVNIVSEIMARYNDFSIKFFAEIPKEQEKISANDGELKEESDTLIESIKKNFLTFVKNPLQIKYAPEILAQQFASVFDRIKSRLDNLIEGKNELIKLYGETVEKLGDLLNDLNKYLGNVIKVNPDIVIKMKEAGRTLAETASSVKRIAGVAQQIELP